MVSPALSSPHLQFYQILPSLSLFFTQETLLREQLSYSHGTCAVGNRNDMSDKTANVWEMCPESCWVSERLRKNKKWETLLTKVTNKEKRKIKMKKEEKRRVREMKWIEKNEMKHWRIYLDEGVLLSSTLFLYQKF